MSIYMEIVEADDTNPNTIKEPAKRWRNWVRVVEAHTTHCDEDGTEHWRTGDIYHGKKIWPSKDAAETVAAEDMLDRLCVLSRGVVEYLGAFPEGEHP